VDLGAAKGDDEKRSWRYGVAAAPTPDWPVKRAAGFPPAIAACTVFYGGDRRAWVNRGPQRPACGGWNSVAGQGGSIPHAGRWRRPCHEVCTLAPRPAAAASVLCRRTWRDADAPCWRRLTTGLPRSIRTGIKGAAIGAKPSG